MQQPLGQRAFHSIHPTQHQQPHGELENSCTLYIQRLRHVILYGAVLPQLRQVHGNQQRLLRSEEHTSELQSRFDLVCRLLLENKNSMKTSWDASTHENT